MFKCLFFYLFLKTILMIAGKKRMVVIKQTATPMTSRALRLMNPRYLAIIIEPNPAMVVRDVRRNAFSV